MEENTFKTGYQIEKEAREMEIYQERKEMLQQPGAMITAIDDYLMKKHSIHSRSTIWAACKRVEKKMQTKKTKA